MLVDNSTLWKTLYRGVQHELDGGMTMLQKNFILSCVTKCIAETNFFDDQKKLDTVYYLMQGLTYHEISKKIRKRIPYVQRVMDYLKDNGFLYWGRWSPNVYKIGMKKSIAFLDWKDRNVPKGDNYNYTTYVNHVEGGEAKILVVYTYPERDESKIKGEIGEPVTPFYYTNPHFTVPFLKKIDLVKEFFDKFDSVRNDQKMLSGTPSFRAEKIYNDPITVYICRYAEILPELKPRDLTDRLEQDFKDYKEIEITYDRIETILNKMKEEEIIFPKNVLHLKPLSYQAALVRIKTEEIYRIMGTFNRFNMLTRVALTPDPEIVYMYIQYPFYQFSEVMKILSQLDPTHKTYIETEFVWGDTIYYQWSLDRYLELKSKN